MSEMLCDLNQSTQPIREYPVFNNWDVVAKGWYVACRSRDLRRGRAFSKKLCGHQITLFRTESGSAHAIDAFCPHMGMDMGSGKVVGETLRCHFHHWRYDGAGQLVDVPCLDRVPDQKRLRTQAYAVEEKYGFVWVYPDSRAPEPVFEIEELKGQAILHGTIAPFRRIAHPHITMMNSIDGQHMRTVHKLDIDLDEVRCEELGNRFKTHFSGKVATNTWVGKLQRFLLEDTYRSSVLFIDGCLGLLTTFIDVKLLRRWTLPRCYYLFSQTFVDKGRTVVYPIMIVKRWRGPLGWLASWLFLQANKAAMWFLAWQDGRLIYHQLRFRQDGLLAGVDAPTARWISYVNRKVEPSMWSRARPASASASGAVASLSETETSVPMDTPS